MRLPKKIDFGGYILKIEYAEKVMVNADECFGVYNPETKTISLSKGMSRIRKKEVFIHEYLHFIEDVYRIKISEENISTFALAILKLISEVDLNG